MTIEHQLITDPEIHEPKGVASAAAGEAYIADGAGSGSWGRVLTPSDRPKDYAQNYIIGNTTSVGLPAGDVDNNATYTKWSVGWNETSVSGTSMSVASDTITINESGTYEIMFWASVETGGAGTGNDRYAFKLSTDGTTTGLRNKRVVLQSDFGGDVTNPAVAGSIGTLSAGDTITLWVAANSAVNLTILDGALILKRLDK